MPPRFTSSDLVAHHLDAALDSLLGARLASSSSSSSEGGGGGPKTWSPPVLSLITATESDGEHQRHHARLKEVVARLGAMSPDLEPHLHELKRAALDLSERSGQVGFAVGASLAVGQRRDTALSSKDGGDKPDGNRES